MSSFVTKKAPNHDRIVNIVELKVPMTCACIVNNRLYATFDSKLQYSDDKGKTWAVHSKTPANFVRLIWHPKTGWVTTKFSDPPQVYIYMGNQWVNTLTGTANARFMPWSIDVCPITGNIYVAEYWGGHAWRVYRSIDGGLNWTTVMEITEWEYSIAQPNHIHRIAVDPYTGGVWLGAEAQPHDAGPNSSVIFYSPDHGDTWNPILKTGPQNFAQPTAIEFTEKYVIYEVDDEAYARIEYIDKATLQRVDKMMRYLPEGYKPSFGMWLRFQQSGNVYLSTIAETGGTSGLWVSSDKGNQWYLLDSSTEPFDHYTVAFDYLSEVDDDGYFYAIKSPIRLEGQSCNAVRIKDLSIREVELLLNPSVYDLRTILIGAGIVTLTIMTMFYAYYKRKQHKK